MKGLNFNFNFLTPKGTSLRENASFQFEPSRFKIHWAVWLVGEFPKKSINKVKSVIFHLFAQKSPWTVLHQIWYRASSPGRNHLCQILCQSVQGFQFCRRSKFAIFLWLNRSPVTALPVMLMLWMKSQGLSILMQMRTNTVYKTVSKLSSGMTLHVCQTRHYNSKKQNS